jgi:hypothetical protein
VIIVCHNDPTDMALLVHLGFAEAEKDEVAGKWRLHNKEKFLLVDMYHDEDDSQGQETVHVRPPYTPST